MLNLFTRIGYPPFIVQCFSLNFNISLQNKITYTNFVLFVSPLVDKYIIMQDNPRLSFNPNLYYSSQKSYMYCLINVNCAYSMDPIVYHKNLYYIGNKYLCEKTRCAFLYKNKKLYYDNNHITTCMIDIIKKDILKQFNNIFSKNQITTYSRYKISYCSISSNI